MAEACACIETVGDSAGTIGMPAIAAGILGEPTSNAAAADLKVLRPVSVLTGEPKATGPYEEELQRGVLPASELATEPVLLRDPPLGVLAGVMKGEKPPPDAEEARMAQAAESWRDMGVEVPEGEEKLDSFC